ncbi:Uncharacterised protein [Mycobacterium tuberculosis]|nr:Uncharacterised protein [Mycobacterium tuberculosis]
MLHCNPEFLHVVRPKTPRGDGNHRGSPALDHAPLVVSSDPKPREGTETFCLMLGRQLLTKSSDPKPREGTETRKRRASSDRLLVVRPKTPRGDGNSRRGMARQAWLGGRQTQNPERGRKPGISAARPGRCCPRSSDPKPREGTETRGTVPPGPAPSGSSDPKPREGTETLGIPCADSGFACRQTQNPERGRKRVKPPPASPGPPRSSDPKPREGTETLGIPCADSGFACRQTQNPERGRKPGSVRHPL